MAKILVVEDEGLTAMELQRKLKTWGYDVPSFAFSRKEAVKKAKEIKPDLILMDVMLKGQGDGIDAAHEIKNIHDVPIIYLTAYGDVKTRKRAEITNPTAYIIKPFEENELQDKIETALSEHRLEKKLFNVGQGLDNKLTDFGVIIIDLNGIIKYINPFTSDLTGFSEEEIVFKEITEVLSIGESKDGNHIQKYLNEFIANENTSFTSKSLLKPKNGNKIHIEYTIASISGESQGSVGASIIFQDVSQQVKDEKSLMEREQKFRNIYSESLATEIFDANGELLDANPDCLHLFGVGSVDELKRFNLFEDFKLDSVEVERLEKGSKVCFDSKLDWKKLKGIEFDKKNKTEVLYLNIHLIPLKLDEATNGYLVQFQDITDHRKLEEHLKNTGERYLKILESLDQALMAYNADLKCVYSNKMIKGLLGFETEEVIGKSIPDSMKSLWDAEMEIMCKRTLETGEQFNAVKRFQKNKKTLFIEIKVHKLFEGLIVILKDVTSTKKIEEDLKRNEELYRSVVSDQSEIICRFNKDLELTFANESYYKFFGLDNNCNLVFSLSDEDVDKMKVQLESLNVKEPMRIFEGPMKMLNDELRWWQWITLARYDGKGHIEEYQSVGRDVTEHHTEMEELQNNLNNLRSSIEDKKNELNLIKKSFKSQIDEDNRKISSLEKSNEDMGIEFKKTVQELKDKIKSQKDELNRFQDQDSSLKENMKLLKDELKNRNADLAESYRALDAEISIRKKSEDKLEKKSLDLKMRVKQTNEALSSISNLEKEIIQLKSDFQEEISNLQNAELVTRKSLDEKEKILKNVYSSVKTNMQMISSLNRLHSEYVIEEMVNKLKDGRSYLRSFGTVHEKLYQSQDLENVNLREYLDSILDDISRSHGANNVDITIKTDDINLDMEMTVLSGLLISELVINSLKHGFPGDMDGKIMVQVEINDNDMIIIVSDDGIGIPPSISLESNDSFGLQLVKTFVEQFEGSIEMKGDNGASFIIKIPKT